MAHDDHDFVVVGDKDVEDFNSAGLLPQSAEDIDSIQRWLHPTDFSSESSEYKKHLASHVKGTGKWIQSTEQFQQWIESSEHGALWIKAVPGAGKSVVAAHLASQLAEDGKIPVLHFFFRQIITTNKTPQSLVRDWMSQALGYSPFLQSKLKDLLKNNRSLESVALDELWDTLVSALGSLPRVYCIVDALDEMDMDNDPFMCKLIQLGKRSPSSVKVVMTSRPIPRIEKVLSETSVLQLPLRLNLVDQDIAIYIQSRLGASNIPESAKVAIERTLCDQSKGLFLYARLMMDDLLSDLDISCVHETLQKLPSGLGDMYNRMLLDHSVRSGVSQELQLLILQCVTHCSRPLRLLEIATVIDFARKTTHPHLAVRATGVPQDTKSIIRAGCGPLLEILEDETVSIVHHSFTEFLFDPDRSTENTDQFPRIDFVHTHRILALTCINYLLSDWHDDWNISNTERKTYGAKLDSSGVRMKYPFLDYAINYWQYHISEYDQFDEELSLKLDELMEPKSKSFLSCLDLMGIDSRPGKVSPLHIAASKGLDHYTSHLLHMGQDVNVRDAHSQTPLHQAAQAGHHKVVNILLKRGAENDPDDFEGLKPLHLAAAADNFAVVKLLLESGVDPFTPKTKEHPGNWCGNAPRSTGETPVEYACQYGHTKSIQIFIPYLDPHGLSRALCWATGSGRTDAVLALLAAPVVDINKMVDGKTPLHLAAHAHDLRSMQKLLEMGADVNVKCNTLFGKQGIRCVGSDDELESSPLHVYAQSCASSGGVLKNSVDDTLNGFKILLEAGCDINGTDACGSTPLQQALSGGDQFNKNSCPPEIIKFLLDNGADPSKNGPPLHLIHGDAPDLIDLLVAYGSDVNARNPIDGRTPLFRAVTMYRNENFMAFIKHGASCNVKNDNGDTPLHLAVAQSPFSASKVKILLENGADPNARNKNGETALHVMPKFPPREDTLSLLLAANADLEVKTNMGLTVLLNAVKKNSNNLADIERLVEAGANLDARDFEGRTVLHIACQQANSADTIRALVNAGADPKAVDFDGNTIFHEAARQSKSYNEEKQLTLLETLLDLGVSPSSRNNIGQTPFHIAAGMRRNHWDSHKSCPYEFLLGPKCNLSVNDSDYRGIRPIHLAASISEEQVERLLDEGADPSAVTVEGQSILHIACRARHSNIVGLIIELYNKSGLGMLIDHVDKDGRTALHYACRSGRLESVKILLAAGADPNLRDRKFCSPLRMCLQFQDEDFFWSHQFGTDQKPYIDATCLTLDDPFRPRIEDRVSRTDLNSIIRSENQTIGIREIVRALVEYGADISFMASNDLRKGNQGSSSIFDIAIASDCEVLVDELLNLANGLRPQEALSKEESEWLIYNPWNNFAERRVSLRAKAAPDLLRGLVTAGESNIHLFNTLLLTENERGIKEFQNLGADLIKPEWNGTSCLTTLAQWGYASLLGKFGAQASMIDELWIKEIEKTNINLPGRLRPILLIASDRRLPNLDVIKTLVEKLGVNVNCRSPKDNSTALHILAQSCFWWQSKALEYLIGKGADLEVKDDSGATPLHIAVQSKKRVAVEILLNNGANPNILDSNNESCLNKAGSDSGIVRQLIGHGADISAGKKPFIFHAIEARDIDTVNLLIEMKLDCNVTPTPELEGNADDNPVFWQRGGWAPMADVSEMSSPLHFAASKIFNTPEGCSNGIPIIQSLLRGGANPLLPFNKDGDPILHDICEREGIISPFLAIPNLDLEARDSNGRTLLLAACAPPNGFFTTGEGWKIHRPSNAELLFESGADITATDKKGRNVLHHLLSNDTSLQSDHRISTRPIFELFLSQSQGAMLASQKDLAGSTPLHYALRNRALWAVDLLLEKGADPLPQDSQGNIALHYICSQLNNGSHYDNTKHNPIVVPLLEKFLSFGLDINTANMLGETPIFYFFSDSDIYQEHLPKLLDAGVKLDVRDKKGQGLLHVLAKKPYVGDVESMRSGDEINLHADAFKWLMAKGLDPSMEDGEQRTPLDIAAASGNLPILEMFKRMK